MPHEMMGTMHEQGMSMSHHGWFWAGVIVAFALLVFLLWWFVARRNRQ